LKNFGHCAERFQVKGDVIENVNGGEVVRVGNGGFWQAYAASAQC